jgi:nucleoside-diphosphate-sugar epimerase
MKHPSGRHKAIITGACGTIGLALSEYLMGMGVVVIGVGREGSLGAFSPLMKQYPSSKFVQGDLLDAAFLMDLLREVRDDQTAVSVFHLAAQSDVKLCEADPFSAFQHNTLATVNVLEACIKNQVSRFIFSSTSYIYGDKYQENIREEFDAHPSGIYPLSKLAAEVIINGYAQRHKINGCIVRISNVYGPQLKHDTVLGTMMSQYKRNDKIDLKDFTPVRDFIYMGDVIEALSRLMIFDGPGFRTFNLSTGKGISMGELAQLFCDVKGLPQKILLSPAKIGQPVSRLVLDNQALSQCLQWCPAVTLNDGLKRIFKIHDGMQCNGKA